MTETPLTPFGIEEKTKALISEHLGVKLEDITKEKRFEEDFGADSLDMVELAMAFENEFQLKEISDDDRARIQTVEDAVKFIQYAEREVADA